MALVSSGRSFLLSSWPTKLESPASPLDAIASMGALPPVAGAGSKPVMRTVMTLILSADCTVASALPA